MAARRRSARNVAKEGVIDEQELAALNVRAEEARAVRDRERAVELEQEAVPVQRQPLVAPLIVLSDLAVPLVQQATAGLARAAQLAQIVAEWPTRVGGLEDEALEVISCFRDAFDACNALAGSIKQQVDVDLGDVE